LLDENLPRQLTKYFSPALDVTSIPDLGWQSKKNGELLTAMASEGTGFLITADRNLRFQQNLEQYPVVVVLVRSHNSRLSDMRAFVPRIEAAILAAGHGDKFIEIELRNG